MVEVDAVTPVVGAAGEVPLIETFEGRSQLHPGLDPPVPTTGS